MNHILTIIFGFWFTGCFILIIPWAAFSFYTGHWSGWRGEGYKNTNAPDWTLTVHQLLEFWFYLPMTIITSPFVFIGWLLNKIYK
ncbi:MAG: hypothetical protein WCG48_01070 [Candidatus Berkelbacteria bacterium]